MTNIHKHYETVRRAHYLTSFSPDKRADSGCKSFDVAIAALTALSIPADKIEKYERLWLEWMGAKSRCMSSMITGPANFPVRRNEKANNSERNKGEACLGYYNKLVAYAKKEAYYEANPQARPVMSGDSDAVERLQSKLDAATKAQEKMKAVNKIIRKKPLNMDALIEVMGTKEKAEKMLAPDFCGRTGFASYSLTNNRAEIKRLEGRIKEIQNRKEIEPKDITVNGVRIVENADDMRLQIFFEGKPNEEMRKTLKSNAFKWAPSKGAWQRQLTNNAIYSFNHYVLGEIKKHYA